jgi:uroporphyrinogen decarboxylase
MYENAWQVRGYEPFLEDLLVRREWAELLLDRFCENNLRTAVAAARAGYDCIATGDDVANQNALMFSPDLWRAVMKPRWARVIAAARAIKPDIHVWYHSDGNIWAILDDLVEIGITILNPVQPECMDPVAIRKRFGKRLAFDGCVGTQTTFPFGTTADMRRVVRELAVNLRAEQGGLMLSPTHVLEPEVPLANIETFFEECDRVSAEICDRGAAAGRR